MFLDLSAGEGRGHRAEPCIHVKPHHAAVSAHISQGQSELSGPARVHAKLEAQRLAARSGETQGSDSGMAHRNPD